MQLMVDSWCDWFFWRPDLYQVLQAVAVKQAQFGQHPLPCRDDLNLFLWIAGGAFVALQGTGCLNHLDTQ